MPTESQSRRPRFSLLTLLLLMAIAAMGIVIWQLWSEVEPLRAEVRNLRLETGRLTIDDPAKAYAIGIPLTEDNVWRSRVYLPPGVEYTLNIYTGKFPKRGGMTDAEWFKRVCDLGGGTSSTSNTLSGEIVIDCRSAAEGDNWALQAKYVKKGSNSTLSGGAKLGVSGPTKEWLADIRARITASDASHASQKEFEADEPILLLHLERPEITERPDGGFSSRSPTGPADGAVLWIAPQAPPAGKAKP